MGFLKSKTFLSIITKVQNFHSLYLVDSKTSGNKLIIISPVNGNYDQESSSLVVACRYHFGPLKWELPSFFAKIQEDHSEFYNLLVILLLKGKIISLVETFSSFFLFDVRQFDLNFVKINQKIAILAFILQRDKSFTTVKIQSQFGKGDFQKAFLDLIKDQFKAECLKSMKMLISEVDDKS